jgi:hypothetical protein
MKGLRAYGKVIARIHQAWAAMCTTLLCMRRGGWVWTGVSAFSNHAVSLTGHGRLTTSRRVERRKLLAE